MSAAETDTAHTVANAAHMIFCVMEFFPFMEFVPFGDAGTRTSARLPPPFTKALHPTVLRPRRSPLYQIQPPRATGKDDFIPSLRAVREEVS